VYAEENEELRMEASRETLGNGGLTQAPWKYRALAAIGRLYPFSSGSAQVAHSKLFERVAKPESAVAWCPGPGGAMLVPLNDFVGRCIYFTGDYDRKISWLCRRVVRRGDVVFDIGANMGVVTLLLARCVGPTGIVHAFEPNPRVGELLTRSASMNGLMNIELHGIALGSRSTTLELNIPRDNAGQGSFIYHKKKSNCDTVSVPVRRLSEVVGEQGITNIRLIKIDVEGFESEVLLGATEILETVRPDLILFETNETVDIPFFQRPVVQILRKAEYRFMALPKSLLSIRVVPIEVERHHSSPSHDIVAVAAEKYLEISSTLCSPKSSTRCRSAQTPAP
jgi:FkbM family methyltransferase